MTRFNLSNLSNFSYKDLDFNANTDFICNCGILADLKAFAVINLLIIGFLIFAFDSFNKNNYTFKDLDKLNQNQKLEYLFNKILVFAFLINLAALVF